MEKQGQPRAKWSTGYGSGLQEEVPSMQNFHGADLHSTLSQSCMHEHQLKTTVHFIPLPAPDSLGGSMNCWSEILVTSMKHSVLKRSLGDASTITPLLCPTSFWSCLSSSSLIFKVFFPIVEISGKTRFRGHKPRKSTRWVTLALVVHLKKILKVISYFYNQLTWQHNSVHFCCII